MDPKNPVKLQAAVQDASQAARISLHLVDANGLDRGALGEVAVDSATGKE